MLQNRLSAYWVQDVSRRVPLTGVLGASRSAGKAPALGRLVIAAGAAAAFGLAGCSVLAPFESSPASTLASDDIVTGSITPRPGSTLSVASRLPLAAARPGGLAQGASGAGDGPRSAGQWRRGALGEWRQRPQGLLRSRRQRLPDQGRHLPHLRLLASLNEPEQWLQGTACRVSPTEWTIKTVSSWKRPG